MGSETVFFETFSSVELPFFPTMNYFIGEKLYFFELAV